MKICAIICEYNPFHNGHLFHIQQAKERSGADKILCVMSGNFVQRGETAVLDKYTRAKHAVMAGADAVLELPTLFSTSNAELFSKGAVHIISSIPNVDTLCFGAETDDKNAFISGAKRLLDETPNVSKKIKQALEKGESFAKARANAFADILPKDLLTSPNNVLGVEYTKALLEKNSDIEILPIKRVGAGYLDDGMQAEYSSATAIRKALYNETTDFLSANLPPFVLKDLEKVKHFDTLSKLELLNKFALLQKDAKDIASVLDCTEGLENAFKKALESKRPLVDSLTSARYTSSRIRRIALQNTLGITEELIRDGLENPLYLHLLAIKKEDEALLSHLGKSQFPLLVRPRDEACLQATAKTVWEKDKFAEQVYQQLSPIEIQKNIFI